MVGRTALAAGLVATSVLSGLVAAHGPRAEAQESAFDPGTFKVGFDLIADGFSQPVQVVDPGDGSGRLFVVEKGGTIRIISDGAVQDSTFLDISDQVSGSSEQGLLSMAFHPDFAENGTFFIFYTNLDGDEQIERWTVSADDSNLADAESRTIILT